MWIWAFVQLFPFCNSNNLHFECHVLGCNALTQMRVCKYCSLFSSATKEIYIHGGTFVPTYSCKWVLWEYCAMKMCLASLPSIKLSARPIPYFFFTHHKVMPYWHLKLMQWSKNSITPCRRQSGWPMSKGRIGRRC